jgi:hypothetical protein
MSAPGYSAVPFCARHHVAGVPRPDIPSSSRVSLQPTIMRSVAAKTKARLMTCPGEKARHSLPGSKGLLRLTRIVLGIDIRSDSADLDDRLDIC